MSNVGAALTKQVGPMPLGAWLLVGGGGLFIAFKSRQGDSGPASAPAALGDPLPTGGGYGKQDNAFGSYDGAPVVLSPIIQLPKVVINNTMPQAPAPVVVGFTPPPAPPTVSPDRKLIIDAYQHELGRAAGESEIGAWLARAGNDWAGISGSQEAIKRRDRATVANAYQTSLGRAGASIEIDKWLARGTAAAAVLGIRNSAEAKRRR